MQTAFFCRVNGKYKCVPFSDVLFITAKKNYSEIFLNNRQRICAYATISRLESSLPDSLFCRVHRSYIVSLRSIQEFDHNSVYIYGNEIPISKPYFETLIKKVMVVSNDFDVLQQEDTASNNLYIG
jgi:DNA-binding LytR/AlgR family response regulator